MDVGAKLVEPLAIGTITTWVYVKIGGDFKSETDFLIHIEKVLVPPIITMTVVASNGGLGATLVKSLLVSQLMSLMGFIHLEPFVNEEGERRWKLSVLDRLFLAMWVPLIYLLLIRGGQSTSGGISLPFIGG